MIGGPGIAPGQASDALVELVDLQPTLLELAQIEPQHTHYGRSLVPLLTARATQQLQQHEDPESVGRAIACRTSEWAYVCRRYEADELYDRRGDPHETVNLSGRAEHAGVVRELRDRTLA